MPAETGARGILYGLEGICRDVAERKQVWGNGAESDDKWRTDVQWMWRGDKREERRPICGGGR